MSSNVIPRLVGAGCCTALALVLGCDRSEPEKLTQPAPVIVSPAPSPVVNALRVWTVSPNTGSTDGSTPVLIHGEGFQPGARVTIDLAATDVTVLSSDVITAVTGSHPIGTVDVVVTNPDGQSGRLARGYTYAFVSGGGAPVITALSPDAGTVGGGTEIAIIGSGFQPGAIVRMDGHPIKTYSFGSSSTRLSAQAMAHPPGSVDVVVLNPDGQSATLGAAYRYAVPGTLDVNGEWEGAADDLRDDHSRTAISFTITNNQLVEVTCNGGMATTMAASAPISNDEFSFLAGDRLVMSGRFLSANTAVGKIEFPPCGLTWFARRR